MPVVLFILGPPRCATTRAYQLAYKVLRDELGYSNLLGVFEPFNPEVVDIWKRGAQVIHDVAGPVPSDYDKLPRELRLIIRENSRWLREWEERDYPFTPFLGEKWREILLALDSLPQPVLVKDVCAWVYMEELVDLLPRTKYLLLLKSLPALIKSAVKRLPLKPNPRHKAGFTAFFRFFTGGYYEKEVCEDIVKKEVELVHAMFLKLASKALCRADGLTLLFRDRLADALLVSSVKSIFATS